jgi:uncharacterized membrane protein YsdA (DUF1294 family)
MVAALAAYLVAVNLVAFAAFGIDKRCAERRARRIPERRLLGLAAAGGGAGAVAAQRLFRHKTVKEPFASRLRLILTLQAIAVALVLALRR